MEEIWKNRIDDTLPYEQWKLINGCSNYYVSSLGRVRTSDRYSSRKRKNRKDDVVFVKGKILKQSENKNGYLRCCIIYDNCEKKSVYVHRLVIKTFLGDSTLPQINHIDENKHNNSVENLEWCDVKYNANYGNRNTKISDYQHRHPKKGKCVKMFSLDGKEIETFCSVHDAARRTGFSMGNISGMCNGSNKYSHVGGYIFKFG